MEFFDESLKYLLHEEPADFLRFGFADPNIEIVAPCETDLPSRGRAVDGSYVVLRCGVKMAARKNWRSTLRRRRSGCIVASVVKWSRMCGICMAIERSRS